MPAVDHPISIQDKTILITGATNGIGRASAEGLARMGATIIIIGRSETRCRNVVESIRLAGKGQADYIIADLADLDQVRQLAQWVRQRYSRLDVLLNNAGAYYNRRQLSPDGYELTFALNYLSHFLLTTLLMDLMKATAEQYGEARIINVASASHAGGKIDFEDLQSERSYRRFGFDAYFNSKLANLLFTFELARRLSSSSITANTLHPGLVATGFATNSLSFVKVALKLLGWMALTPQEGAQTSIYLASSPDVQHVSGQYFVKCKPVKASDNAYDEQTQRRLWDISLRLVAQR